MDPDLVTYKIPANDDAIRSVKLFAEIMANAIIEGNNGQEAAEANAAASGDMPVNEDEIAVETMAEGIKEATE